MRASEYTQEDVQNACLYGICLTCNTPRRMSRFQVRDERGMRTHFQLIYPCGHSEADQDFALAHDPELRIEP